MDRRRFLIRASGTLVTVSTPFFPRRYSLAKTTTKVVPAGAGLSANQWRTLAAVQQHLFPSEPEAPGASDVNAASYLHLVLCDPDFDAGDREFVRAGVDQLEQIIRKMKLDSFVALDEAGRERALQKLVKEPGGEPWVRTILNYVLEALLTDPVYGGNPGGIGWKWLRHQPGSLRPPRDKRYFLLPD